VVWQFGRYRMEELIARGGMGEVHRAYDTEHDRVVAVKLLAGHVAADSEFRARFAREARGAARLREPHVIPIHAYGEIDGRLYLDMRLVEGEDLSARLARGPMDPAAAVEVVGQVARALDAAHAEGLVHRDVKPSNVLLDAGGFAYLVDFGIARSMTSNADITGTGVPIGTVAYMSPERFASERVDHRADVYSLACLLFECLTGARPFPDRNPLALMHAHLHQEPPRATAHRPGLSPAFDQVVATGMAKSPDGRFPSAGALASAARLALDHPAPARTATLPSPAAAAPAPRGRRWWLVAAVVLAVVALAGAAAVVLSPHLGERTPAGQGTTTPATTTTTAPTTAPTTKAPAPDLSVAVPLSAPACDGGYILIVGSAVDPRRYQSDVREFLEAHPGARYLHAPSTGCRSLRQRLDGADIYSVYYGPFPDKAAACEKRAVTGGDSFVRRLDDTSTPDRAVSCG
jgi:serine/threonine-protein kinase